MLPFQHLPLPFLPTLLANIGQILANFLRSCGGSKHQSAGAKEMASVTTSGTRCFQYMWADAGLSGFETLASFNPMRPKRQDVFWRGKFNGILVREMGGPGVV